VDLLLLEDVANKLFCTFAQEDELDNIVSEINKRYTIQFGKIFILYSKSNHEYICTYNVDMVNVSNFIENTILVHRKKETNTLYTINALNTLIKQLNEGVLDTTFKVDWEEYKNCILLTKGDELKRVNTKLHKIIEV
jgi:CRISPR/Cas system-associated protein Cas10 (large subunit of type III CRISPR-Cas system)